MSETGRIYGINGPVIYVKGDIGFKMSEMVYVGPEKLVGEVISLDKNAATVQVFEDTTGIRPGDRAEASGHPLSVSLAPGILLISLTELNALSNRLPLSPENISAGELR